MQQPRTLASSTASPPVPGRDRGDACPGALKPHAAADGQLLRLRIPGGLLGFVAMSELADIAATRGDGTVRLTARGNVELRGLAENAPAELSVRLADAGLLPSASHERVRNITRTALSGLDDADPLDLRAQTTELDQLLCGTPRAADLSGRFLFALDDGRGDTAARKPDISIRTLPDGSATPEAALLLAGADTGIRVPGRHAARCALHAALTFLTVRQETAPGAWRITDLPDGGQRVAADLPAALRHHDIPHRLTEPHRPAAPRPHPAPLGATTQRDGRVTLAAAARFGRFDAAQCRLLVEAAQAAQASETGGTGDASLDVTGWRACILPNLPPQAAREWHAALTAAGLLLDPDSTWTGVTACTGLPGCAKSHADVRADATAAVATGALTVTADTPRGGPAEPGPTRDPLPVHFSGCERRCGRPHSPHVDVLATEDGGYQVRRRPDAAEPARARSDPDGADRAQHPMERTAAAIAATRRNM